jgi:hypothetical protein
MVNRRGVLKIIEATIAILIILGALILIARQAPSRNEVDLTVIIPPILDELAQDDDMRARVLEYGNPSVNQDAVILTEVRNFIEERISNPSFEFDVVICDLGLEAQAVCNSNEDLTNVENVYVVERVISTTQTAPADNIFKPKRVKVFLWRA